MMPGRCGIWLDTRYDMQLSMVEGNRLGELNLERYNTILLPDGFLREDEHSCRRASEGLGPAAAAP